MEAVELVKAAAWPVIALVLAVLFRRPLALFLGALGSRVTRLSVFKVELELVPATSATSTPLLDDIRTATSSAAVYDSKRMMLEQVQVGTPADYAKIDLGEGKEWLTSRLFIAAATLERMRGVQALVFVEKVATTDQRLVAVAAVSQVRWALAQREPWLEAAWARAYLEVFPAFVPKGAKPLKAGANAAFLPDAREMSDSDPPLIKSRTGGLEPSRARQLVVRFIDSLQKPAPPTPTLASTGWVVLGGTLQERATWVTRDLLRDLLPAEAFFAWSEEFRDAARARRTRAVLRHEAPFVGLVDGNREFVRLVNRRALLEEIASSLGEEPEASGSAS